MMGRREFIALLGGAAAWPRRSYAQQATMRTLGYMSPRSSEVETELVRAFQQGLRETGYAEGKNITVEYRWAEGRYQAQATLGAQAPMPLQLQARGELSAQVPEGDNLTLRARATAQGTLAGADAALDLTAQIEPAGSTEATPTLAGSARAA